ncbi:hypothetical protein BQ8482_850011 [Mesorhizobium delmotii]|uniref:Transposase DDE domain-containing protein n=1 Tax=Mesorhizobium delmotii TaxID=1631247 RepID=A0A2P9AWR1_9HYPH|nr:hypothetical protein BQ8482_850011 [Mesorhizobium delmotii]
MQTECSAEWFGFGAVEKRAVVAGFDGGTITSDAGALLLGLTDWAIGLVGRFARCFVDARNPDLIEHEGRDAGGQRTLALALGYEDLNDHDELRHDPVMAVLVGKLKARRHKKCAAVAGKSTLNRLELSRPQPSRYHKISHDPAAIEALFVELFVGAHAAAPEEIVLDLDATDDPLHGNQERRFFHGYYGNYCYLRSISSVAITCCAPSCGPPTSMRRQAPFRRSSGSCTPTPALAQGAHRAARRFRLRPRGADGLVREQCRRLPVRPGSQCPAGPAHRG